MPNQHSCLLCRAARSAEGIMSDCQRLIIPGTSASIAGQTSHEDDLGVTNLQMRILHFVICRLIISVTWRLSWLFGLGLCWCQCWINRVLTGATGYSTRGAHQRANINRKQGKSCSVYCG